VVVVLSALKSATCHAERSEASLQFFAGYATCSELPGFFARLKTAGSE